MNELDTALRDMLAERAQDITQVPSSIANLTPPSGVDTGPGRRAHRRTIGLVAATIATVLAVAAGVYLVHRGDAGTPQPAGPNTRVPSRSVSTSPAPRPTITPPAKLIARTVALTWFKARTPTGYQLLDRTNEPGAQMLTLRPKADDGVPKDCNGCGTPIPTASITVYDAGKFAASGLTARRATTVDGHPAYFGTTRNSRGTKLASVAWTYAPNAWAVVQGMTPMTSTHSALLTMADSVRADVSTPVLVPFRLEYVPAGYHLTQVYRSISGQYPTQFKFENSAGASMSIALYESSSYADVSELAGSRKAVPVTSGGRSGRLDLSAAALAVRYATGRIAAFSLANRDGLVGANQRAGIHRIADALTWVPGSGIPAEDGLP